MTVWEDDWRDRSDIVKCMIKHRLGISTRVLDARKMKVEKMTSKSARAFFDANHLDGHTPAKVTYGLIDQNGEHVAMMSLRRPFHKRLGVESFEVGRSACALGVVVRGWAGKLSRALHDHAVKEGKRSLITYVDGRVGDGSGYKASGWTLLKPSTGLRFWWTDYKDRYDRFKYKVDSSRGLTQRQVADEAGVVPIFGCSNSLWSYAR